MTTNVSASAGAGDWRGADQIREIEEGRKAGLDTSLYDRKEFLAIQMRQIRLGLAEGLDVSVYARPEYDWFQMEEIREGLKQGVAVDKYASPEISYDRMRQIRKGLKIGLDLSRFVKLDAKVLRQLRKAFISKVNINEYVKERYDAEQLEQIRIALEKGLVIKPYLVKEFRGVSIQEIRLGLEAGLEVERYASMEYSWRQMREIRLGLEGRLDTSLYEDPLYNWQQMQELRLGLEEGLDISEFNSLMYTHTDMKRIRMKILERYIGGVTEGEQEAESVQIADFLISVSADEMEAYLQIKAAPDQSFKSWNLEQALRKEGISHGVLSDEIKRIIEEKDYNRKILIAKGKPAEKGRDGYYEFFVGQEEGKKPAVLEDGSVDYQQVQWFEMVEEGQKLAIYHPATPGVIGFTVRGGMLKPIRGREEKVLTGKGFLLLFDKCTYVAAQPGKADCCAEEYHLEVSKVCLLPEVTRATGNVDFDGSVIIKGDVGRGVSIRATEDIIIDGGVEACEIFCGGSVLLRQGANGMGEGNIEAAKNVEGKYFEGIAIKAGEKIRANFCLNCHLRSEGDIVISGNKGVLAGGIAQAIKGIYTHQLGNRAQIKTMVRLGVNDEILLEQRMIDQRMLRVQSELSTLGNAFIDFQRKYPPEIRNAMEIYIKLENAIYTKELEQEKLIKRKEQLQTTIHQMQGAGAYIRGQLFEGSIFEIDKVRWIATPAQNVTVKRIDNRIGMFNN